MAKKNSGKKGSRSKSSKGSRSPRTSIGTELDPRKIANPRLQKLANNNIAELFSNNPRTTVSNLTRSPAQVLEDDVATNKIKNYSPISLFFIVILYIVLISINYMALMWIQKLDEINCECSKSWMHTYIKYFLYTYFIIMAIAIMINLYLFLSETSPAQSDVFKMFGYVLMVFNIFGIANVVIALIYIDKLKRINCECSEDVKREIYWYYNIIMASLISFVVLLSIISAIILGVAFSKA
jgi:hypothetical protein